MIVLFIFIYSIFVKVYNYKEKYISKYFDFDCDNNLNDKEVLTKILKEDDFKKKFDMKNFIEFVEFINDESNKETQSKYELLIMNKNVSLFQQLNQVDNEIDRTTFYNFDLNCFLLLHQELNKFIQYYINVCLVNLDLSENTQFTYSNHFYLLFEETKNEMDKWRQFTHKYQPNPENPEIYNFKDPINVFLEKFNSIVKLLNEFNNQFEKEYSKKANKISQTNKLYLTNFVTFKIKNAFDKPFRTEYINSLSNEQIIFCNCNPFQNKTFLEICGPQRVNKYYFDFFLNKTIVFIIFIVNALTKIIIPKIIGYFPFRSVSTKLIVSSFVIITLKFFNTLVILISAYFIYNIS